MSRSFQTAKTPRNGWAIQQLSDLHDDQRAIYLCCENPHCLRSRGFTVPELLDLFGPDATTLDVERRARCSACGTPIGGIRIAWRHGSA